MRKVTPMSKIETPPAAPTPLPDAERIYLQGQIDEVRRSFEAKLRGVLSAPMLRMTCGTVTTQGARLALPCRLMLSHFFVRTTEFNSPVAFQFRTACMSPP